MIKHLDLPKQGHLSPPDLSTAAGLNERKRPLVGNVKGD